MIHLRLLSSFMLFLKLFFKLYLKTPFCFLIRTQFKAFTFFEKILNKD